MKSTRTALPDEPLVRKSGTWNANASVPGSTSGRVAWFIRYSFAVARALSAATPPWNIAPGKLTTK